MKMEFMNDPFLVGQMTLFGNGELLRDVHPAMVVGAWIEAQITEGKLRDFAGFASVLFTTPLGKKGRPQLISHFHRRMPLALWGPLHRYCDVDTFLNQHIQEEVVQWHKLVRAAIPECDAQGRAHATSLLTLVGEGHFTAAKGMFEKTYRWEGYDIEVMYKDYLVQWVNTPDFTYWFIARLFDYRPEASLVSQEAFTAAEIAAAREMPVRRITDEKRGFRPSDVQPSFAEHQSRVRDLAVLGFSNQEIGNLLGLAPDSVKKYLTPVLKAYGVKSRSRLLAEYLRRGGTTEGLLHLARQNSLLPASVNDKYLRTLEGLVNLRPGQAPASRPTPS